MRLTRPFSRRTRRLLTILVLVAWPAQMGYLVYAAYLRPGATLAGDLARYGTTAHWKGLYYRAEKIGFSVSETIPRGDGYELREDGQLHMGLFGATAARLHTSAEVTHDFDLRRFEFSIDPGTGPISVSGTVDGKRLTLTIGTPSGQRQETRVLADAPVLSLNLPRRLAAAGLVAGQKIETTIFDPATMRNGPMTVDVEAREVVWVSGRPVPAFRVQTSYSGITSRSWVTDVGEVVREESPTGFVVAEETRERATAMAVSGNVQAELLNAVAIKPQLPRPIDDALGVLRLRLRFEGAALPTGDLDGVGQRVVGRELEFFRSGDEPADGTDADRYLKPEPLIESDAPEIRAEAQKAVGTLGLVRARAERLTHYVSFLIEKKPTVSIPSALEVLRTRVGDCNEHTALFVAMARALGIPARVSVGLVFVRGAFYYHAWPEVLVPNENAVAAWTAVDPTLDQFPADATHIRIVRGGLDKQVAVLPLIGQLRIQVTEVQMDPRYTPVLVGQTQTKAPQAFAVQLPRRTGGRTCWSPPE